MTRTIPVLSAAAADPHPERRITAMAVRQLCGGVSHMWLVRRLQDSDFPRPTWIAGRRYWREADVVEWLKRQEVV